MPEYQADHERRIATIEGQMQSVATKADLADLKHDLTLSFQSAIKAQTDELQESLDKHGNEIRQLREKDSRLRVSETL